MLSESNKQKKTAGPQAIKFARKIFLSMTAITVKKKVAKLSILELIAILKKKESSHWVLRRHQMFVKEHFEQTAS